MIVLHYAGVSKNNASGVSVIVPQIMNAQSTFGQIGFYNYGKDSFDTVESVVHLKNDKGDDDYHTFPEPFNHPDIVIFHSPFGIPRCALITKKLKKDKIPYVIVPHGCFSKFAMKKKRIKKRVARALFMDEIIRNSAKIQYLSEGEKEASIYDADSFVVPNGVVIPRLDKNINDHKYLNLSFIGRKDLYHKGLDLLIDACGIAKNKIKDSVRVNIYGPSFDGQDIDCLIEKNGVGSFVFNKPAVFGEEKHNVYLNTDVFVLTSRFEGQPVAILEAWAYGVPTLVTPGTNVFEECVCNQCGWGASASAESIAHSLIELVRYRDEINQFAKNAERYVSDVYSWENISKQYHREYSMILYKKVEKNI